MRRLLTMSAALSALNERAHKSVNLHWKVILNKCAFCTVYGGETESNVHPAATYTPHSTKAKIHNSEIEGKVEPDLQSDSDIRQKLKSNKVSYVFERHVAEEISKLVVNNRENREAPVLQLHAGTGVLCEEFLKRGISKVVALETNKLFFRNLKKRKAKLGEERFVHFNWPMMNFYLKLRVSSKNKSILEYQRNEAQVSEALRSAQYQDIEDPDVPFSLFMVGGKEENHDLIFYILRNLPVHDPILSQGRVEFFFLAHPRFKEKLRHLASMETSCYDGRYRYSYIHSMLHLLYDVSFLGQFNSSDFYPPFNSAKAKLDNGLVDPSQRLLVKMQLKENVQSLLPFDHHVPFLTFLRQLYKKKVTRTIPAMEMLVPGCGIRMLAQEFTMMDRIITCRPERFLQVYKAMLTWPEYPSSPLSNYIMTKTTGGLDHHSPGQEEETDLSVQQIPD